MPDLRPIRAGRAAARRRCGPRAAIWTSSATPGAGPPNCAIAKPGSRAARPSSTSASPRLALASSTASRSSKSPPASMVASSASAASNSSSWIWISARSSLPRGGERFAMSSQRSSALPTPPPNSRGASQVEAYEVAAEAQARRIERYGVGIQLFDSTAEFQPGADAAGGGDRRDRCPSTLWQRAEHGTSLTQRSA